MHDAFVAVGSATDLRAHAADLRDRWDTSFAAGRPAGVRSVVADSWTRMLGAGLAPDRLRPRSATDADTLHAAREASPLRACLPDLRGCLAGLADDAEHIMVVADAAGTLLWIDGHERVLDQAQGIDFRPGMAWTERSAGTNAIGTALAIDHAVQIFSAEHFLPEQHPWWCSAAPIHHPQTGELVGVVDLSGPDRTAHPHSLGLVTAAASIAEQRLRLELRQQAAVAAAVADAAPRTRTLPAAPWRRPQHRARLQLLTPHRPTLTLPGEEPQALSPRQAEVLALLVLHPDGLSAGQLTLALYGEDGTAVTTRALVSRLRDVAGDALATRPYRLAATVRSDLATVRRLLAAGDGAAALAMYPGPLLPGSEVPAVERARDEVDMAVRGVALRGDVDALWRWLRTPTGEDDLAAVERFVQLAEHDDPRLAVARARGRAIRASWDA